MFYLNLFLLSVVCLTGLLVNVVDVVNVDCKIFISHFYIMENDEWALIISHCLLSLNYFFKRNKGRKTGRKDGREKHGLKLNFLKKLET